MSQVTVTQAIQLGLEHHRAGRLAEAEAIYRQVLAHNPNEPEALHLLGAIAGQVGQTQTAIELIRRAIAIRPMATYYSNLSRFLLENKQAAEAEEACRKAITLYPGFADAHYNLGNALGAMHRFSEAAASYREALRLKPEMAEAATNLGNVLKDMGRVEEAVACYRKTVELDPTASADHSNLLLALQYLPGMTGEKVLAESREWDRRYAAGLTKAAAPHSNERRADKRIKVGYVSPDFRDHSVAYFMERVLAGHDRAGFEVFCYADFFHRADAVTERLKGYVPQWRETTSLSDAQLAELVRRDEIDVLVDLAGHTAHNRLMMFARKPAPVQVTYLGYPATTGMGAMDYRLTDAWADPIGAEVFCTEELVRLGESFLCYAPVGDAPETTQAKACTPNGEGVTFGCFNAMAKINAELIGMWAGILRRVAGSRMLIKNAAVGQGDVGASAWVLKEFEKHGVGAERVEFLRRVPGIGNHLGLYGRVDVALDTYPYCGTTTTCEALWMGVPVVTLTGQMHASRVGMSLLSNVGLAELAAGTAEEYQRIAVDLAGGRERLAGLRGTLRERMRGSRLMDGAALLRELEGAYRAMWQDGVRGKHAKA